MSEAKAGHAERRQRISAARRVMWHVNRSPLKYGMKALATARQVGDKRVRRALAGALAIDDALRSKAATLRSDGYVEVKDIVDSTLLEQMAANGMDKVARATELARTQASAHKDFWVRLLDEDMLDGAIDIENMYARYALQRSIVGLLAAYYGEVPILDYVLLTLSRESEGGLRYSQLWHRDHDDVRTVKLFVYLTDVAQREDGPFTFLPGPISDRFGFSLKSHLRDERVFAHASKSEVKEMIAPRLSSFLVETSRCLHMGSRMAPGHERLLYTATFLSAPRLFPRERRQFRASRALTEVERKLLEM